MKSITVKAPAKVNVYLKVVGRRSNGYHDLEMVMVPLTLADEITLTSIPSGVEFHLKGDGDSGMRGEKNLACRAANMIRESCGRRDGVRIELAKNVPVAAGLGGGSSDAAAVLKGLNKLWNLDLMAEDLAKLGVALGADVPFFCYGAPSFVEGIGDRVTPYDSFPNISFLLVNPGFGVSTPWVYQQYDLELTPKDAGARVRPHFQLFSEVSASLHNDLEAVTIKAFPEISKIKDVLIELGAAGALMSGSGPTVFGVFEEGSSRDRASSAMTGKSWRIFSADVWRDS